MNIPSCGLCPRACRVRRDDLSSGGRCSSFAQARVALCALHRWEEPVISGTNGSGAIFFSGCTLGCVYCQNREISHGGAGKDYSAERLAQAFQTLESDGAHNIDLVTGTHFIPAIIKALKLYRPQVPVIWNSSGYETAAAIDAIAPYIDIWLPDFKYARSDIAEKYSTAPDYPQAALAALLRMRSYAPQDEFGSDGIMKRGMIVRHLVLPGNTRNSIEALRLLHERLPQTLVSLMSQYTPVYDGEEFPELKRRITKREYDKVCDALYELDMDGFAQERSSSGKQYIPKWDL